MLSAAGDKGVAYGLTPRRKGGRAMTVKRAALVHSPIGRYPRTATVYDEDLERAAGRRR